MLAHRSREATFGQQSAAPGKVGEQNLEQPELV
jgi:hypothetical protein